MHQKLIKNVLFYEEEQGFEMNCSCAYAMFTSRRLRYMYGNEMAVQLEFHQ
jgi:hypothetical protein